jgi:hypothetical protein
LLNDAVEDSRAARLAQRDQSTLVGQRPVETVEHESLQRDLVRARRCEDRRAKAQDEPCRAADTEKLRP